MGRTLQIETPRAYVPLLAPTRYKGAHGGRGSAKSHFFADLLIEYAQVFYSNEQVGLRWVCVREVQKSLEQSVKLLLEDKIKSYGLTGVFNIMHTEIVTPGGGLIIFQGMQDHTANSIKSLEGYDGAWVEEAQSLSDRSLTLLRPTIRKEKSELWFSWNPDSPKDPVDKMLRSNDKPDGAVVVQTTFRDNPWFPDVLRKELEWDRRVDHEKYVNVWEGGYQTRTNSRVFKNWRVEEFDTPDNATFFLGSDWGYSVDPATLVRCFESRKDSNGNDWPRKRLYIDHERFGIGVEIDDLPAHFDGLLCGCSPPLTLEAGKPKTQGTTSCAKPHIHGWARAQRIVADSSRPDTISYLRRNGYGGIEASKKGPNSVREGIIFLQGYDILIHPRCTHTIDEFTNFSFVIDKLSGLVTNELEDKKNHIIDPMRYALEQLRGALQIRRAVWG
jgi:phage terminase large subunit